MHFQSFINLSHVDFKAFVTSFVTNVQATFHDPKRQLSEIPSSALLIGGTVVFILALLVGSLCRWYFSKGGAEAVKARRFKRQDTEWIPEVEREASGEVRIKSALSQASIGTANFARGRLSSATRSVTFQPRPSASDDDLEQNRAEVPSKAPSQGRLPPMPQMIGQPPQPGAGAPAEAQIARVIDQAGSSSSGAPVAAPLPNLPSGLTRQSTRERERSLSVASAAQSVVSAFSERSGSDVFNIYGANPPTEDHTQLRLGQSLTRAEVKNIVLHAHEMDPKSNTPDKSSNGDNS